MFIGSSKKKLKAENEALKAELEKYRQGFRDLMSECAELKKKNKEQEKSFAEMRRENKKLKEEKLRFEALASERKNKIHKIRMALESKEN